jgi:hypothetical protein
MLLLLFLEFGQLVEALRNQVFSVFDTRNICNRRCFRCPDRYSQAEKPGFSYSTSSVPEKGAIVKVAHGFWTHYTPKILQTHRPSGRFLHWTGVQSFCGQVANSIASLPEG